MKPYPVIALILIVIGAAVLGFGHFSYRSEETVLDLGPLKATAERQKTVRLPSVLGWALVGSGAAMLVLSRRSLTS